VKGWAPSTPQNRRVSEVHMASPEYFKAMGIPLIRGRLYTPAENTLDAAPTVVVTPEFVKKYFPNEDPIGKQVTFGITHDTAEAGETSIDVHGEIIGVVGDVKRQDLASASYATAYVPFNNFALGFFSVVVRTHADPKAAQAAIRTTVREVDRDLPVFSLTTMKQAVSDSVAQPRFYMLLLGAFAAIALLLAALGIYGVIAYTVSQRTRELGIRIALGATREKVVRLVIGHGVWLAGAGVVLGVLASLQLTKVIASLMFGVGHLDPLTFVAVPVGLLAIATLASYLPARRASQVDPVIAMRNE
jgi:putative ABC transport system permease protein